MQRFVAFCLRFRVDRHAHKAGMLPLIEASLISGGLRLQGRPIASIHSITERRSSRKLSFQHTGFSEVVESRSAFLGGALTTPVLY